MSPHSDDQRLRRAVESFIASVEQSESARNAPRTGMQVPDHSEFGRVPPSVANRLTWYARLFRSALEEES